MQRYFKMLKVIKNNLDSLFIILCVVISGLFLPAFAFSLDKNNQICDEQNPYMLRRLASEQMDNFCEVYKGKLMLVVNTASRCGYTDQYDELEKLYSEYKDRGLVVIGFPSNDFGNQEPGNEQKIQNFCRLTYGVKFPMYAKTRIKGNHADPLYKKLSKISGQEPKWNFHKYLINRDGELVGSFKSSISPYNSKIIQKIEKNL